MGVKLNFISNNVKGLESSLKKIKIIKINLGSNGFLFWRETHSSFAGEKKWVMN